MRKKAILASTDSGSYLNLLNPLSPLMGGGDKYPKFMADMFPGNSRAAWMASKVGAIALLAMATAGTARVIRHLDTVNQMAEDHEDPANKMRSQLGTTFAVPLGKRAGYVMGMNDVPTPGATAIVENSVNVAAPLAALVLAAATSWKAVDHWADARRNRLLTSAIDSKSNTVRALMQARARVAKGTITPQEVDKVLKGVDDESNYVKTAAEAAVSSDDSTLIGSGTRAGLAGFGLLLLTLAAVSGVGSYKYFSAADPDNIKYKAMKQGLKNYARSKSYASPVTTIPQDAEEYFSKIDQGKKNAEDIREQPEMDATRRPISITI